VTSGKQIYVRFKGRTLGPFTQDQVQKLAIRGQVSRMHELSADGLSWTKAEKFGIQFSRPKTAKEVSPNPQSVVTRDVNTTVRTQAAAELSRNDSPLWHVHVAGVTSGPVTHQELIDLLRDGRIGDKALLWRDGLQNWIPAQEVFGTYPANKVTNAKQQWVTWTIAIAIALTAVLTLALIIHGSRVVEVANKPTPEPPQVLLVTNSIEIGMHYDQNEIAADMKYKGKEIIVTGIVEDIGRDIFGSMYVNLITASQKTLSVQCFFDNSQQGEVSGIEKFGEVTIRGKCVGKLGIANFGSVVIKGCRIQ